MTEIEEYRSYGEDEIELCKHISIHGHIDKGGYRGCEYVKTLLIRCKVCKETHEVQELIN